MFDRVMGMFVLTHSCLSRRCSQSPTAINAAAKASWPVIGSRNRARARTAPMNEASVRGRSSGPQMAQGKHEHHQADPNPKKAGDDPCGKEGCRWQRGADGRGQHQVGRSGDQSLIMAIWTGSLADSFRVRLLSMPQLRHAATTSRLPASRRKPSPVHESRAAPARMATAPNSKRRSTFSWKMTQAMTIVARPSTFSSSEPADALVMERPSINSSGPSTPPKMTTAANHGRSDLCSDASGLGRPMSPRPPCTMAKPQPAPK